MIPVLLVGGGGLAGAVFVCVGFPAWKSLPAVDDLLAGFLGFFVQVVESVEVFLFGLAFVYFGYEFEVFDMHEVVYVFNLLYELVGDVVHAGGLSGSGGTRLWRAGCLR